MLFNSVIQLSFNSGWICLLFRTLNILYNSGFVQLGSATGQKQKLQGNIWEQNVTAGAT